jgi:hypothetical protein
MRFHANPLVLEKRLQEIETERNKNCCQLVNLFLNSQSECGIRKTCRTFNSNNAGGIRGNAMFMTPINSVESVLPSQMRTVNKRISSQLFIAGARPTG